MAWVTNRDEDQTFANMGFDIDGIGGCDSQETCAISFAHVAYLPIIALVPRSLTPGQFPHLTIT